MAIELEQLTVSGTPLQMGAAQGEHFRARIAAFVEQRFDAVRGYMAERKSPVDAKQSLLAAATASLEIVDAWDPEAQQEHRGIAKGAGVDPVELYAAANMTDMRDVVLLGAEAGPYLNPSPGEGCSTVLVPATHGGPLAAQTWDLNPPDVDFIVAVRRRPVSGPQTWAVTCAGCLTLMGINEAGVAVGTRGTGGGYRLARKAGEVTLLEVIDAFEPSGTPGGCLLADTSDDRCDLFPDCELREVIDEVDELVRCTFASITLETLVNRRRPHEARPATDRSTGKEKTGS